MGVYVVEIPGWHPPRLNGWQGYHWSVKAKAKAAALGVIYAYCGTAGVPRAACKRRVGLTIRLGYRQRGGDPDSYWKALLDGLVHCGALVNDSKEWVELVPVRYERAKEPGTVLELEDIGNGESDEQPDGSGTRLLRPRPRGRVE